MALGTIVQGLPLMVGRDYGEWTITLALVLWWIQVRADRSPLGLGLCHEPAVLQGIQHSRSDPQQEKPDCKACTLLASCPADMQ